MQKKIQKHIKQKIAAAIAARRLSRQSALSKKELMVLLEQQQVFGILSELLCAGRIDCAKLLAACHPVLDAVAPEPSGGWLQVCTRYICEQMFSGRGDVFSAEQAQAALLFLTIAQAVFEEERTLHPFDCKFDFVCPPQSLVESCESVGQYRTFWEMFQKQYIYELMRISAEITPFQTLSHIAGVHFVATNVAQRLLLAGCPIDLAMVSAAAAGHDLGKFGCRPGERVPYLHYYYTDRWFKSHGMDLIGHIAANHSTWDLEPENLPVESLVLIYADFRTKQLIDADGREHTGIFSLAESYDVILKKLDNVDEKKRQRYALVYARLADFEKYMISMGVDVELQNKKVQPPKPGHPALLPPEEVVWGLSRSSIAHNIALMSRLNSERQFGFFLEAARSEKKWKNIRAYIDIIEEYCRYLSAPQKILTLDFLYELLMHREGDIRRQAAKLVGKILSGFNAGYRKELPANAVADGEATALSLWEQYLERLLHPDHKLTAQHKQWVGYTLKIVVSSIASHCERSDWRGFLQILLRRYTLDAPTDSHTAFVLLDVMLYIPLESCRSGQMFDLAAFAAHFVLDESLETRVAALRALRRIAEQKGISAKTKQLICDAAHSVDIGGADCLDFLQGRLYHAIGQQRQTPSRWTKPDAAAVIFLDNLKTSTPWVVKAVNIKMLLDLVEQNRHENLMHIATHLSNLIKVSERVVVRHDAGAALLKITPLLSLEQRNEIAIELVKGLEVGEYEFSKYIPDYLGEFALWLPPEQLSELLSALKSLICSANDRIVTVALASVGAILERISKYRERFAQTDEQFRVIRETLLGMLVKSLAGYRVGVRQEAMLVLGKSVFSSKLLTDHEKRRLFALCAKKLLVLFSQDHEGELTFYYRAAVLNHIYRFIALQQNKSREFKIAEKKKLAFFPGSFDPFTLSHKGIVDEIRKQGFEVMLAVDEFSWSKKTQPHLIRQKIVAMSVADMLDVQIFPEDIPVNIANPADLKKLSEIFARREVYIVVGSDVLLGASSYQKPPQPSSVHNFAHIVFLRQTQEGGVSVAKLRSLTDQLIRNKTIILKLPVHLEDISSTRIREDIDHNRDISSLIDPVAQEYIYNNGFYLREPQYKPVVSVKDTLFEGYKTDDAALPELLRAVFERQPDADKVVAAILSRCDGVLVLKGKKRTRPVGIVAYSYLGADALMDKLQDYSLAQAVRGYASGRMLLISALFASSDGIADPEQKLAAQLLSQALADGCIYGLYQPIGSFGQKPLDCLLRQGFLRLSVQRGKKELYAVDMRNPIVLLQNLRTAIKEPLASQPEVIEAVQKAHHKLQQSMTALAPGELVLSLSAEIIHHRLIEMITEKNNVPNTVLAPRVLGECMCVPFGKLLRGRAIPNTVTKTLHTDKVYDPLLKSSTIEAFLYYPPLESQIKMIKSFDRPCIMVDDLLHGGDRMQVLDPLLKKEKIKVKAVLVGILSGNGKDIMELKGYPVDGVYTIPNLRHWFVESTLYPFFGGDTVRRDHMPLSGMLPSVNMILPYASPKFKWDCSKKAQFELSLCCIENARDLLLVLEAKYRALFGRNLTLARLSEAIILPLCPDRGSSVQYDPNLSASVYLDNDIELLLRTRKMME